MADCENGGVEDASLVMTRVLAHLERVVDHVSNCMDFLD